jgi:hypothetical protein
MKLQKTLINSLSKQYPRAEHDILKFTAWIVAGEMENKSSEAILLEFFNMESSELPNKKEQEEMIRNVLFKSAREVYCKRSTLSYIKKIVKEAQIERSKKFQEKLNVALSGPKENQHIRSSTDGFFGNKSNATIVARDELSGEKTVKKRVRFVDFDNEKPGLKASKRCRTTKSK